MHVPDLIKLIEEELKQSLPLTQRFKWLNKGYTLDANGHVTHISLHNCGISSLKNLAHLLSNLKRLSVLILSNNHINSISPLHILRHSRHLKHLDLSRNKIKNIKSIQSLVSLKKLELDHNLIEDISIIKELTQITTLSLVQNKINDISAISALTKLSHLNFSSNLVTSIQAIENCKKLQFLWFYNNHVTDLNPISSLKGLTQLGVGKNNISSIEPLLNLTLLKELQLVDNNLKNINNIELLTSLTTLYLSDNYISNIYFVKNLANLKNIELQNNPIETLPSWITDTRMDIKWGRFGSRQDSITLYNNPLKDPPLEIIKQGKAAIKLWFNEEKVYMNEVKVLLVGNGDVGKTTLVKCLMQEAPNPEQAATHHIQISTHTIEYNQKNIKLNFWDFGGQEVMHATHQFFLSARSVYILVLDGRRDEDAEYWLKHIESFGGNSPVLVVLNKIDNNPAYDVNRQFLQDKYPFIIGFYRTVCMHNLRGISELEEGLKTALNKLEILTTPWPKNWLPIKNSLEEMASNYISQTDYEKLCEENGVTDRAATDILADYLNDLGVVVHFKKLKLSNLHILQPRWASRAAYKIINSSKVAHYKGLLKEEWLDEIMRKADENDFVYQRSTYLYILNLMLEFELCFSLKEDQQYLVPELMDIQQPELPVHVGPVLHFYLQFEDLLPRSIMPRFIVRMHEDIQGSLRWRTGVVLSVPIFGTTAIVIADVKERRIYISVSGPRRREHFALLRRTFHSLKNDFKKLPVTEWIPLPDAPGYALDYEELIAYEDSGREEYFVGRLKKTYQVKDLLDGIEPESIRREEYEWDAFLCHSSADKNLVRNIAKDLQKRGIRYWLDDDQIEPGDHVIDKIVDGLQRSRNIIPCLSSNQFKSGWARKEYQSVLMRIISGTSQQRVTPLILDDTPDQAIPLFLGDIRCERYGSREQYERLLELLSRHRR